MTQLWHQKSKKVRSANRKWKSNIVLQLYENILDDMEDYMKEQQHKEEEETRKKEKMLEEDKRQKMLEEEEQRFERQRRFELELEEKKMKLHQEE